MEIPNELSYSKDHEWIKIEGDIASFEIYTKENRIIKKYFPEYDPRIILKDTKIKFTKSKSDQNAEFNGLIKVKEQFDDFHIKEKYNYDQNL